MPTHKLLCDLDVGGEVKGTSLDINGNGDISGNLTGLDKVTSDKLTINTSTEMFSSVATFNGDTYTTGGYKIGTSGTYVGKIYNSSGVFSIETDGNRDVKIGSSNNTDVITVDTSALSTTFTGDINANGNIVGDDSTSITNIDNIQLDNVMADADTTTRIGLGSTSMEFLVADSDVMDLNETTLNVSGILVAKKHKLAITSSTDGNADGDIVYFGSTTSMDTGKIYYLNSSGSWALADADAESTAKGMLGVALGTASNTNGVLIRGMVTLDHDPGTQGDTLFLSTTAGTASSTAPSGNGDIVRVIGYCLNSSNGQVYFNPDGTFVEVTA